MPDNQQIQIVRLEEQFKNITTQFAAQNVIIGELSAKIDALTAIMNQGKGAYAASIMLAGVIGGAVMALIEWVRR